MHADDVICMSDQPMNTMKCIYENFKIKNNKIEEPIMCLGPEISEMHNETNKECWVMSSDSYYAAAVANATETLSKEGLRFLSKHPTPLSNDHRLETDVAAELKADGVQHYQELVGVLR